MRGSLSKTLRVETREDRDFDGNNKDEVYLDQG